MVGIGILVSEESFFLDLSSQDIIDKTARSAGKRALCMGGAKNHLIAMPDCDEVGLQEYRNKGLEKSVGFVLKYVKHIQTFLAPDAIQSSDFTICDFRFVCFSLHLYEDPLPFSGFHDFLHHPAQQDMTISDIMNSAFGSAGQRCMAASILIIVGKANGNVEVENWESTCGWMESWEWFLGSLIIMRLP